MDIDRVISCELNFDLACAARAVVESLVHVEITIDTEQLTAVGTHVTLERGRRQQANAGSQSHMILSIKCKLGTVANAKLDSPHLSLPLYPQSSES